MSHTAGLIVILIYFPPVIFPPLPSLYCHRFFYLCEMFFDAFPTPDSEFFISELYMNALIMLVSSVEASVRLSGYQGGFKDQGSWFIPFYVEALLRGHRQGACRRRRPCLPSSTFPIQAEEMKMSKKKCLVFSWD